LIQEGSLGLIRAAEKFDHENKFFHIRDVVDSSGNYTRDRRSVPTIRLPVHLYETISRIKKTTKLLSEEMGRKPLKKKSPHAWK